MAISKADLLDEELMEALKPEIPQDVPHLYFSSVTGFQLPALKDLIWRALQ